jgi:hypothetical protein
MRHGKMMTVGVCWLAAVLATTAGAREKRLKKADLPPAVQKTADEQSRGATVKGYASEKENGRLQYEVQLLVNGHFKDVTIAPDGKVLEIEEEVALDALPAAVREGLQRKAGPGKITQVESISKRGSLVAYEAHVTSGGKRSEIQVGPDGKALAHPE